MTANDGTVQRVDPNRLAQAERRLDEQMALAEARGEHVWVVAAAFSITAETARKMARGEDPAPLLDAENLLSLSPGCFRCEEPLTRRLLDRRCRGEQ